MELKVYEPSHMEAMAIRPELLDELGHRHALAGYTLFHVEQPLMCGGIIDAPWGEDVWIVTAEQASRHKLAVVRTMKFILESWLAVSPRLYSTCDASYYRSVKLLLFLGFRPWRQILLASRLAQIHVLERESCQQTSLPRQ